ncbi:hypothetical protein Q5530_31465 [Saccharothrix sp. BKS2]|uniref:hypothetical protein n=1 Tax=Saccharothrix sp. BKS2 TaxID=3064400 RepID=UPI0039E9CD09
MDACIAINLLATDRVEDISRVLGIRFLMVTQAAKECGEVYQAQQTHLVRRRSASPDDLPFAEVLTLDDSELDVYVELARDIDDGEAATIAVARSRALHMATDDRKARRIATQLGLAAPTGTTTILRDYADAAKLTPTELTMILRSVRDHANYIPRHIDDNIKWWISAISIPPT